MAGALAGYNGTIMAYGQTGGGKTHTMTGDKGTKCLTRCLKRPRSDKPRLPPSFPPGPDGADLDDAERRGVIPRALEQV